MNAEFLKLLHLAGIVAIFMGLGAMLIQAMNGTGPKFPNRRWVMIFHGLGMATALLTGLALFARQPTTKAGWPIWLKGKFLVWFIAGGISTLILRIPKVARWMWLVVLLIALGGAALALYKPI